MWIKGMMKMDRQVKIVKLRTTGIKARIVVLPKDDLTYMAGYIFAPSKQQYQSQLLYYFCENFLQDIIPEVVGKSQEYRDRVFKELYTAITEYNPEIEKAWKPVMKTPENHIMHVKVVLDDMELEKTGTPKTAKTKKITKGKISSLSKYLASVVFGQERAIKEIQEYMEISYSGVGDPVRPRGSFIFIGDTGTGKTLTVKEIAKHLFGDKFREGLFIINGSEYMEEHEAAKLLGSPQGYVGYDDGSPFLKHVQKNPESVILVDEFEKANPRLQDIFLQILDEGACYGNKGERVDFSKTLIIFTSNIGTKDIYHKAPLGFGDSPRKDRGKLEKSVDSALRAFCRIEFLKRFDGIIVFDDLNKEHYRNICMAEILKLEERLSDKSVKLNICEEVVDEILNSMQPEDTSRDLNTLVRKMVAVPLSKLLMTDEDFDVVEIAMGENGIAVRGVKDNALRRAEEDAS